MSEPTGDTPWYRSPWTGAFAIGVVTLTLLRPCTRQIPEAPAVEGQLVETTLASPEGTPLNEALTPGRVAVVGAASPSCSQTCPLVVERLVEVAEIAHEYGAAIDIVVVIPLASDSPAETAAWLEADHGEAASTWTVFGGEQGATNALLAESFGVTLADGLPDPRSLGWLALVDGRGGLRGRYDVHRSDVADEVAHRAQHILMAHPVAEGEGR